MVVLAATSGADAKPPKKALAAKPSVDGFYTVVGYRADGKRGNVAQMFEDSFKSDGNTRVDFIRMIVKVEPACSRSASISSSNAR
ncbi:MAG TPA: hypothetical protein VK427_01870 [Kofleriaceae bacterium]|nr:hypothetical protein [Kofleriaceae bacterium]